MGMDGQWRRLRVGRRDRHAAFAQLGFPSDISGRGRNGLARLAAPAPLPKCRLPVLGNEASRFLVNQGDELYAAQAGGLELVAEALDLPQFLISARRPDRDD